MGLADSLTLLRDALGAARFPLRLPDAEEGQDTARQIVTQLDDYILPRLANLEAPVLAVVGGSTGAGKSTLVSSLIGRVVTRPGVIRPTTKSPVLVHNPEDAHWFEDDRILPGMVRTRTVANDRATLQLVVEPTLPQGLAILDAPDIDSVESANRILATQLLDAADLWLFVTSAARYADVVPWGFLQTAVERGASIAVICDRVPPGAMHVIPADLGRMMIEQGLAQAPLFAVPETLVDAEGLLPDTAVAPIRSFLAGLAADNKARGQVVRKTLDGAINSVIERTPQVTGALRSQISALMQLDKDATGTWAEATRAVQVASADGTLLRGEVLTRWHDYVGTGDLMRNLDKRVGMIRDRIVGWFTGNPERGEQVGVAVGNGLEALTNGEGQQAAERVASVWRSHPAGRELMAAHPELATPTPDFAEAVARTIRQWQSDVLDLVSEEGRGRRSAARIAAFGVNGVGAALMLFIFFSTGGITGAEGGVAVGSAVVAQRLLEAVFGDEAVRRLAKTAKDSLDARIEGLFASELARYTKVLADFGMAPERTDAIISAVTMVQAERDAELLPENQGSTTEPKRGIIGARAELGAGGAADQPVGQAELEPGVVGDLPRSETVVYEAEFVEGDNHGQA